MEEQKHQTSYRSKCPMSETAGHQNARFGHKSGIPLKSSYDISAKPFSPLTPLENARFLFLCPVGHSGISRLSSQVSIAIG